MIRTVQRNEEREATSHKFSTTSFLTSIIIIHILHAVNRIEKNEWINYPHVFQIRHTTEGERSTYASMEASKFYLKVCAAANFLDNFTTRQIETN